MNLFLAAFLAALFAAAPLAAPCHAVSVSKNLSVVVASAGEEFVGPFANWINAQTGKRVDGTGSSLCTGATGNGSTDDAAALQSCINYIIANSSATPVLYLLAGTYKITAPLTITSGHGISLIGADPATTTISWGGAANSAVMLKVQGTHYSRIDRLTFNGNNNVGILIQQSSDGGAFFDTGNEYTDDIFTNAGGTYNGGVSVDYACGYTVGVSTITAGNGCAESSMLRDQFSNGNQGVAMGGFNALDAWIWYSAFTNKVLPLVADKGNMEAFSSNFLNSTSSDILYHNQAGGAMTFAWNYSSGAAQTFSGDSGPFSSPLPLLFEGNTILNTGSWRSIVSGWQGPFILLDNTIISQAGATAPVVNMTLNTSDILSTGNRYTKGTANTCTAGGAVQSSGRCIAIGDSIVSPSSPPAPTLPGTPPNTGPGGTNVRVVYEAAPSGSGSACSAAAPCSAATAISSAVATGNYAVAHLQAGAYSVAATISVDANTPVQIIGDGINTALSWTGGVSSNPVLQLTGPSKAVVRDLDINGGSAGAAIKVTNADQMGSRVFMEQPYIADTTTTGLLVNGPNYTSVEVHDMGSSNFVASGTRELILVNGGAGANVSSTNIFAGQSGTHKNLFRIANNGHLAVRQFWNDVGSAVSGATLSQTSSTGGSMSIAAMAADLPTTAGNYFNFTNFSGISALLVLNANEGASPANEVISGTGTGASNLTVGFIGCSNTQFADTTSPIDSFENMNPQRVATCGNGGSSSQLSPTSQGVPNLGAFLNTTLAPLRAALPTIPGAAGDPAHTSGVTDVRLYRINIDPAVIGIDVEP